jgi:hypothetical protein
MDAQTERCAHCGSPSTDGGRYCLNCGAELGTEPTNPRIFPSATDTAERVYDLPAPAYAAAAGHRAAHSPAGEPVYLAPDPGLRRPAPGPGLWIGAATTMVVVLLLGGYLLLHGGGGDGQDSSRAAPLVPQSHHTRSSPSNTVASSSASASAPSSSATVQVKGPPTDVAGFAQASAPSHAPAGLDFTGAPVTYVAANMVDGRNDTCWRTPGDATGTELTFRLDQPTRLTRVGLVNGYSKIAYSGGRAYDWYLGNRRVLSVEWIFDDGSGVSQTFGDDRAVQQTAIHPVTTTSVRLRITGVSPPGRGPAARDDTAISEVLLLGRTA